MAEEVIGGEAGAPNEYEGMSPEHEALIRRLHQMQKHPDFDYCRVRAKIQELTDYQIDGTSPIASFQVQPIMRAEDGWSENVDIKPIENHTVVEQDYHCHLTFYYRRRKR